MRMRILPVFLFYRTKAPKNFQQLKRKNYMKVRLKQWIQAGITCLCVLALLCPITIVHADELDSMESQSSDLKNELDNINEELLEISNQIAEIEVKSEALNGEIEKTQEQLLIARENERRQYEDMELRIQYIYENNGESLLGLILSAQSLADFVNKVDFVKTLNEYDRNMVNELQALRTNIEEEEARLKEQQQSYIEMEKELNTKKAEMTAKAEETSTDLNLLTARIQTLKDEKAAKAAEAAAKAAQMNQASQNNQNSSGGNTGTGGNGGNSSEVPNNPGGGYIYPSGPGQLNPFVGVVYFNGHRETYYSQKVLPGYGLSIPGRHVASDGTVRDGSGYLCLASSDHPKGTVVETSLGTGIVYDTGCASGTIDIYTDW